MERASGLTSLTDPSMLRGVSGASSHLGVVAEELQEARQHLLVRGLNPSQVAGHQVLAGKYAGGHVALQGLDRGILDDDTLA